MPQAGEHDGESPLVEACRAGDASAFGELVRRHNPWVRGVVFAVLGDRDGVEDVAQHVWISAWQRFGELREPRRLRSWLYRLAHNAAIDARRRRGRQRKALRGRYLLQPVRGSEVPRRETPEGPLLGAEVRREVLSAVRALPDRYREPFVLRHLNGWSYQQIAEAMGMPVDSIETRLVRARRLLRDALRDKL